MARVYWRPKKGTTSKKKLAPDNGTWWLDFTDATGKRRQERSAAATQTEAEALLREVAMRQDRLRKGLEVDAGPVTFEKAARGYIETQKHLSSWKDLKVDLEKHVLPHLGRYLLAEVTPALVDSTLQAERAKGIAEGSLRRLRVRMGAVYRWATQKARLYSGPNPVPASTSVRVPEKAPRYFSMEQLEALLAHAGEWRLLIAFTALTGMRKGEVAGLLWEDVDLETGVAHVRRSYGKATTKSRRERVVPLPPALLAELKKAKLASREAHVFPAPQGGGYSGKWHVKGFDTAMRKAGLTKTGLLFKHLRSTYATHLVAATGDIRLAQVLLGHSSPQVTAKAYAHAHLDYLRKGVAAHPLAPLAGRDTGGTSKKPSRATSAPEVTK